MLHCIRSSAVFLIVHSAVAASNSVTIYEVDNTVQAARPITLGRIFARGEIPGCPQPVLAGRPDAPISNYQSDVKNRWADGSVKFAIISFTQRLNARSPVTIQFRNAPSCNNDGFLTQAQMVNFHGGNWGADIEVAASGVNKIADAKAMLQASDPAIGADCRNQYWLKGPVVTEVIVQDCTSSFGFDFGWHWNGATMAEDNSAQYRSLHPVFILSFYPGSSNVKVDYILENMWSGKLQDQEYAFVLKSGNPPAPVYSHDKFRHLARARWRKTFWSGTPNGHIRIDHNFAYLISTRALPNYDQSVSVNPGSDYKTFAAGDKGDIGGAALDAVWRKSYSDNNEGAPIQREDLDYLYNMGSCGTANGACAKAWYILTAERGNIDGSLAAGVPGGAGMWNNQGNIPYHIRESRSGGNFYCPGYADKNANPSSGCGSGAGNPTGRPVSRHAHSEDQWNDSILPIAPVGSYSLGGWSVAGCSHWLDYSYVPYLLTGDYYYLDEEYQGASYCLDEVNSSAAPWNSHGFFGYMAPVPGGVRNWAWGLQVLGRAAFLAVDDSVESRYYNSMVSSNAEVQEGIMNIAGTESTPAETNPGCSSFNYLKANRWDWGHCTVVSQCTTGPCVAISPALHAVTAGESFAVLKPRQGSVVAAANTNPAQFTAGSPHGLTNDVLISLWGADGRWRAINNVYHVTRLDAIHFSIPISSTHFGELTGPVSFSDYNLDNSKTSDFHQDWMYWQLITVVGHLQELGFTQLNSIATQTYQRLIEEIEDPAFNPYLAAQYLTPVKNGANRCQGICTTTNPFLATWGGVKAAFVPYVQSVNTFDHLNGLISNYPCADHGYSLLARAAGTYVRKTSSGTLNGSDAWRWLDSHVPYFTNSPIGSHNCAANGDAQVKYALAPR